jgi:hypothetical protein
MIVYVPTADVFEYDDNEYYLGSGEQMDGKAFVRKGDAEKYCAEFNWGFLLSVVDDNHSWNGTVLHYLQNSEEGADAWEKFAAECRESYPGYSAGEEATNSWEEECAKKLEKLKGLLLPAMLGPWRVTTLNLIDEETRANSASAE